MITTLIQSLINCVAPSPVGRGFLVKADPLLAEKLAVKLKIELAVFDILKKYGPREGLFISEDSRKELFIALVSCLVVNNYILNNEKVLLLLQELQELK